MRSLGWMEKRRKASQSRRAEEERWGRSAVGGGSEGTTGVEEEEKERRAKWSLQGACGEGFVGATGSEGRHAGLPHFVL